MYIRVRRAQYTRRALVITQFNAARAQVSRLCRSRVCVPTVPVSDLCLPSVFPHFYDNTMKVAILKKFDCLSASVMIIVCACTNFT